MFFNHSFSLPFQNGIVSNVEAILRRTRRRSDHRSFNSLFGLSTFYTTNLSTRTRSTLRIDIITTVCPRRSSSTYSIVLFVLAFVTLLVFVVVPCNGRIMRFFLTVFRFLYIKNSVRSNHNSFSWLHFFWQIDSMTFFSFVDFLTDSFDHGVFSR